MRRRILHLLLGLPLLGLAACGFHLRGQTPLSFATAYVQAGSSSALRPLLERSLELNGKRLLPGPEGAGLIIRLEQERRGKDILSLSGGGRVREFRLSYALTLSAVNAAGRTVLHPTEILLTREYTYDDAQALAKEREEAQLLRDMEQEMLRQVLRRLAAIQP